MNRGEYAVALLLWQVGVFAKLRVKCFSRVSDKTELTQFRLDDIKATDGCANLITRADMAEIRLGWIVP